MNKKELDEHRRLLIELVKEKELKIKELQQRIDKAIEWIKEDYDGGYFECGENDIKELLEILGDKE